MPQILDTPDINARLAHLFEDARRYIVLICPYLKIARRLRRTIEVADSKGVSTFLIYGKEKLDGDTFSWFGGLRHSSIGCVPDLHAKLYMNEEYAVIASMNLYEFSQVNNEELGVLLGRREDRAAFKDLMFQVRRLAGLCQKEHGMWDTGVLSRSLPGMLGIGRGAEPEALVPEDSEKDGGAGVDGSAEVEEPVVIRCHCIRCGRVIPSTHEYVYCGRCMDSWRRYSNMRYVEQNGHCYICGRECSVSAEKPACQDCFRAHADLIRRRCEAMRAVRRRLRPFFFRESPRPFLDCPLPPLGLCA